MHSQTARGARCARSPPPADWYLNALPDPEIRRDPLPQPFRMIDKIVRSIVDQALDVHEDPQRERLRREAQQPLESSGIISAANATCFAPIGKDSRVVVGLQNGCVQFHDVFTSLQQGSIPVFEDQAVHRVAALPMGMEGAEEEVDTRILVAAVHRLSLRVVVCEAFGDAGPVVLGEVANVCSNATAVNALSLAPDGRFVLVTVDSDRILVFRVPPVLLEEKPTSKRPSTKLALALSVGAFGGGVDEAAVESSARPADDTTPDTETDAPSKPKPKERRGKGKGSSSKRRAASPEPAAVDPIVPATEDAAEPVPRPPSPPRGISVSRSHDQPTRPASLSGPPSLSLLSAPTADSHLDVTGGQRDTSVYAALVWWRGTHVIELHTLVDGETEAAWTLPKAVTSVAVDDDAVVLGFSDGSIALWDALVGRVVRWMAGRMCGGVTALATIPTPPPPIGGAPRQSALATPSVVSFSAGQTQAQGTSTRGIAAVLAGGRDGRVCVYNAGTGEVVAECPGDGAVTAIITLQGKDVFVSLHGPGGPAVACGGDGVVRGVLAPESPWRADWATAAAAGAGPLSAVCVMAASEADDVDEDMGRATRRKGSAVPAAVAVFRVTQGAGDVPELNLGDVATQRLFASMSRTSRSVAQTERSTASRSPRRGRRAAHTEALGHVRDRGDASVHDATWYVARQLRRERAGRDARARRFDRRERELLNEERARQGIHV